MILATCGEIFLKIFTPPVRVVLRAPLPFLALSNCLCRERAAGFSRVGRCSLPLYNEPYGKHDFGNIQTKKFENIFS
jgi:hypothetical protein